MPRQSHLQRLLDAWPEGKGMTQAELVAASGLSQASVSRYMNYLTAGSPATRKAHICGWRRAKSSYKQPVMVYKLGPGYHKPCPFKPLSNAELTRRSRAQRRASGEWEERKARERARYWKNKPASRDPLVSAFFGAPQ